VVRSSLSGPEEGDGALLSRIEADDELSFRVMALDLWMEAFGVAV
jgi:hypothetical protein